MLVVSYKYLCLFGIEFILWLFFEVLNQNLYHLCIICNLIADNAIDLLALLCYDINAWNESAMFLL